MLGTKPFSMLASRLHDAAFADTTIGLPVPVHHTNGNT